MARPIVVGVDGSEGSERALAWCAAHAPALGSEVVAVHAFSLAAFTLPYYDLPAMSEAAETTRRDIERLVQEEWTAPLDGVAHRAEVVEGPPTRVLMDVAEKLGADMVVVGSRGRGGFAELLLGSVSHQLAHHANCPVVIVPPLR